MLHRTIPTLILGSLSMTVYASDSPGTPPLVKPVVQRPVGFPPAPSRGDAIPTPVAAETSPSSSYVTRPVLAPPPAMPVQAEAVNAKPVVIEVPREDVQLTAAQVPADPSQVVPPPQVLPEPRAVPEQALPASPEPERRLPGLAAPQYFTPKPSAKTQEKFNKFVDQVVDPENTFELVLNRERLLRFKDATRRVQVSDTNTVGIAVIGPREISLTGKKVGSTVLNLWFADPANPNREEVLSYLVRVLPDPELRDRLERVYSALAEEINTAFPDSVVKLQLVGDKLVVSGHAKDVADAFQILRIARANAPQAGGAATIPIGQLNVTLPAEALAGQEPTADTPGLQNYLLAGGPNVVNMLRVGGEQQVMLKVCVAEVNRAAARSIGINFLVSRQDGQLVFFNATGGILQTQQAGGAGGGGGMGAGQGILQSGANLGAIFGGGQVAAAIDALRTLNLAKSLAEPNLVTLNGRPASFQAGGQFPVPVVTGFTSAGLQGVTYVPFGVQLNFTPVITDQDRIQLSLNAEVSTRDLSVAQTNIGGASVPSLSTRNFQSTVEMRAGETLAIAGLVQSNFGSDASRVPFFGDMPVFGRLFAYDRTATSDQELVVLVTPHLVHPLGKDDPKPPLPGFDLLPPTDLEFYLLGRLQHYGPGPGSHLNKKARYCEQNLLIGPTGYSTIIEPQR